MEEEKNWRNLPMQLKIDIFSMLDRDSRLALQLTSRSNCDIAGRCPQVLKSLDIHAVADGPEPLFSLKSTEVYPDSMTLVNRKQLVMGKAADEVVRMFKNKRTRVKELKLFAGSSMNRLLKCLIRAVRAYKSSKNFNCKFAFRVEQLHWIGNIEEDSKDFCTFLSYFDASVLDSIRIENYRMDRLPMIALHGTQQFKDARKCSIQAMIDFPIECFLHFNEIDIKVASFNGKDIFMIVKKFRTEPLPVDSFFCIASDDIIDDTILDDLFDQMELPIEDRESISSHTHNHVSKHSCHDPNTVFILKLDSESVYGCIVSNSADQRTRMDTSVYMNLRVMGVNFNDL